MEFFSEAVHALSASEEGLVKEAIERAFANRGADTLLQAAQGFGPSWQKGSAITEARIPDDIRLEGIILRYVRPPLLVQDGTYRLPAEPLTGLAQLVKCLEAEETRKAVNLAISRTGSLALLNVPGLGHVATGWVVRRDGEHTATVVTNRHVARHFAAADGLGRYPFHRMPNGDEFETAFDLKNEHNRPVKWDCTVEKVLYIAPDRAPDIALLQVRGSWISKLELVDKQMLEFAPAPIGEYVGLVGYPAEDPHADRALMEGYYEGIYDRKRFCFGRVRPDPTDTEFAHDASTLGGNSGSMVFDLKSGAVVGLHYGWVPAHSQARSGGYNLAVKGEQIKAVLNGLASRKVHLGALPVEEARSTEGRFRGRDGFNPGFLGCDLAPPVPSPDRAEHRLAVARSDDDGLPTTELRYRHFSVWMSESRLVPLMTAVNIDGTRAYKMGRGDWWFTDHRLDKSLQIDNSGYKNNPLDRGHMVRREDPVWGDTRDEADEANRDTFAYTNAAPQHEGLNQKHWLALEDYILGHARTRELKVSVFTGPVLDDSSDPWYRPPRGAPEPKERFRIPLAFWKIACVINTETGKPSVSGYLISQGTLIRAMLEEFAYGGFLTYQVPLRVIAKATGLGVDHLIPFDPLERGRAVGESTILALNGPLDIIL